MSGHAEHTSVSTKVAACIASYSEDFLSEVDFDAILAIIDADILDMKKISSTCVSYDYAKARKLMSMF